MKKAQGLSLNYVVVGVIALVVLVVIVLVFTSGMRKTNENLNQAVKNCKEFAQSGETAEWMTEEECKQQQNYRIIMNAKDQPDHMGMVCCVFTPKNKP